jgi:ABC-type Fe3+ transport system permease subunit
MKILKIASVFVSFILAILFCAPIVVLSWLQVSPAFHQGEDRQNYLMNSGLSVDRYVFSGWQMWGVATLSLLIGIAFALVGVYMFKSRAVSSLHDHRRTG